MRRQIIALLSCLMLLCCMNIAVFAQEVPDLAASGTVELTITPGGEVTVYRVGDIVEDDGNYSFALTDDYADAGLEPDDVQNPELAQALAKLAKDGVTVKADDKGHVIFAVDAGLYLLVQTRAEEGNYVFNPFLISMPNWDGTGYNYEVDATPKVGTPPETEPTTETTEPKPTEPKLPQTGQLNWPVPLLAVAGLVLFTAGWYLRFGRKKDGYEE